ncbi:hypothetical protein NDU88_003812 [Pleurodeles waltl]|uniref:Uncharacterized protein n=1 Tax=Pleurodeles waltl TaxID=8319 RepID=A0AAV7TPR1_PLEWA|nr:hypothetical protein NDU88_003812 [Pleurodeles waltl]
MQPGSAPVQTSPRAPAPASRAKACISAEALSVILGPSPQLVRGSSTSLPHPGPHPGPCLLRWASSQRQSEPRRAEYVAGPSAATPQATPAVETVQSAGPNHGAELATPRPGRTATPTGRGEGPPFSSAGWDQSGPQTGPALSPTGRASLQEAVITAHRAAGNAAQRRHLGRGGGCFRRPSHFTAPLP